MDSHALAGRRRLRHTAPPRYDDVVAEVRAELARSSNSLAAGVAPDRLILDPGLGFAKNAEHNWELLAALPDSSAGGFPS